MERLGTRFFVGLAWSTPMLFKHYRGFNYLLVLIFLLIISNCTFIELRVHPAIPNQTYSELPDNYQIHWIDDTELGSYFGAHNPFIFKSRALKNRYGSMVYFLNREVNNHPNRYPALHSGEVVIIHIKKFSLSTNDSCTSNLTEVQMIAELNIGGKISEYYYKDEIYSYVTDCYLLGSTLTLVPLLVYTPYTGFRGNREDQLNQLGRNLAKDFLGFLAKGGQD